MSASGSTLCPPPDSAATAGSLSSADKIGSLGVFWALIEPILARLRPRRLCEVGVENGAFTARLLAWSQEHGAVYGGIDPAPDPALAARLDDPQMSQHRLLVGRSLEILPTLARCGAYFLDGDHNYHTVRAELDLIQDATAAVAGGNGRADDGEAAAPVVFVHDVGWPWGRRDLYYQPSIVPAAARQPASERLGVTLGREELIDGGLRDPGRYAIAQHAGGPRNGVLTAVEDFLAADPEAGWEKIIVPAAYGLAILYRPADPALPAACREHLRELRAAAALTDGFLRTCEENFLALYLHSEHTLHAARCEHQETLLAYGEMERVYGELQQTYRQLEHAHRALGEHADALDGQFRQLGGEYDALLTQYGRLESHSQGLQSEYDKLLALYHALAAARAESPAVLGG